MSEASASKVHGKCHCGAVEYEAEIDLAKGAGRCNCSICTKISQLGAIVKPGAFRLLKGKDDLSTYAWGAKISTRYFCKHCGVHVYGAGHLDVIGGDFVSVNLNTAEGVELAELDTHYFDGRHDNWMAGTRKTPWPVGGGASAA